MKLKKLVTAGIEGLARYTGMDQKGVYFRARHFSTESECICRCDKATGKVEVLSQLSFDREDCYYHVDVQGCKVYRITEGEETCLVKGIVNSGVQGEYQKQLGEFVSCVEDRFLITRKVMTDSHGNDEFEYHSICDMKKKTEESFECKCVVSKNTLVLGSIDGKNENLQECFLSYRRLSLAGDPLDLLPAVGTKPAVRGAAGASGSLGRGGIKLLIYGLPVLLLVREDK